MQDIRIKIKTGKGDIELTLFAGKTPITVANFLNLSSKKFYDGTAFHRIMKTFMAQGGDPLTKDLSQQSRWGTGSPGYQIQAEFNDIHHGRGVISMARSSNPDSAGSQFFLCLAEAGFLDRQYTAFGKVTKGDDVLTKIADTPVTRGNGGEMSKPTEIVKIESIEILDSTDELFTAQAARIAQWNAAMKK